MGGCLALCLAALGHVCSLDSLLLGGFLTVLYSSAIGQIDDLETRDHLCYLEPGGKKPGSAWVWGQHGGLALGSRGPGPFLPARLASWPGLGPSPLFCRHTESLWVCYSRCHCCCLFVSCSPLSTSLCVPACHCLLITGTFPDTSLVPRVSLPLDVGPQGPKLTVLFFLSERDAPFSANPNFKPALLLGNTPTIFTTTLPNWTPGQHTASSRTQAPLLPLATISLLQEAWPSLANCPGFLHWPLCLQCLPFLSLGVAARSL